MKRKQPLLFSSPPTDLQSRSVRCSPGHRRPNAPWKYQSPPKALTFGCVPQVMTVRGSSAERSWDFCRLLPSLALPFPPLVFSSPVPYFFILFFFILTMGRIHSICTHIFFILIFSFLQISTNGKIKMNSELSVNGAATGCSCLIICPAKTRY